MAQASKDQQVAALHRDGYSVRQIAAHLRISSTSVHRILQRAIAPDDLDGPLLSTKPRMTPAILRAEVGLLVRQGYSATTIARRLGVSRASVYRYLP